MVIIQQIRRHPYLVAVLTLTLIGLFLRLYRLEAFLQFLGDQGRDAIIIKRILTLEHFPAVGAPSSIGQVYLGPFYYYFISPWLLLSGFHPIGLAIGVAFFSTLLIPLMYVGISQFFGKQEALVAAVIITFSSVLVMLSRFSWNPNLLPLFGFLAVFFLLKALDTHKRIYFILTGVFLSCAMQLHYVTLAAGPGITILLLQYVYTQRKELFKASIHLLSLTAAFVILSLPLIIFDMRHDLLNFSNFVHIFSQSRASSTSGGLWEIFHTFSSLGTFTLGITIPRAISLLLLLGIMLTPYIKPFRRNRFYLQLVFVFVSTLIVTSYFTPQKYPHYFGFLYPLFISIVAYLLITAVREKTQTVVWIVIVVFIFTQFPKYEFVSSTGSYQIEKAQEIAQLIYKNVSTQNFQVTSLPDHYGDSTQRYFLELWGKRPLDKDSRELADELFVMCEQLCKPIGDPQWDIAYFQPTEVVSRWEVRGVKIYKLVR